MNSPDPREPAFSLSIPASPHLRVPASLHLVTRATLPFLLALAIAISCYFASGVSLGLFFGPLLLITFLAPPLAMGEDTGLGRLAVCAMLTLGVWLVWLVRDNLSAFDLARTGVVLFAYILALNGTASFLETMRLGKTFAASATALIGIVWLTWPIWLCPWLRVGTSSQILVNCMTVAHPLMAMNAIVLGWAGAWDRFEMAYHLTSLNQDIAYALPRTITWMIGWHIAVGAAGLSVSEFFQRRGRRAT